MPTRADGAEPPSVGAACPEEEDDASAHLANGRGAGLAMRASPVPRARRASPPTAGGPRRTKTADVPNKRGNERKLTVSVAGVQQDVPQQATSKGNPGTGARLGDPEFRDYVRARRRSLLRTAYLLTGNLADAEDLVQSALAKTYVAWDRIEDRGALDGYVRRAIVNTHISSWRRRRLEEFPTDELPDQVVADHSVRSDLQEALRVAVDRLPERMRAAIQLRFYQDMTEAEVAQVLGVSLGTVKSTVARAVAKLRIDAEQLSD